MQPKALLRQAPKRGARYVPVLSFGLALFGCKSGSSTGTLRDEPQSTQAPLLFDYQGAFMLYESLGTLATCYGEYLPARTLVKGAQNQTEMDQTRRAPESCRSLMSEAFRQIVVQETPDNYSNFEPNVEVDRLRYKELKTLLSTFQAQNAAGCDKRANEIVQSFLTRGEAVPADSVQAQFHECDEPLAEIHARFGALVPGFAQDESFSEVLPPVVFRGSDKLYALAEVSIRKGPEDQWESKALAEAWESHYMGKDAADNPWGLPGYRRGFYVAEGIGTAGFYSAGVTGINRDDGSPQPGGAKWPWLQMIEIDSSCRKAHFDPRRIRISAPSLFASWWESEKDLSPFASREEFAEICSWPDIIKGEFVGTLMLSRGYVGVDSDPNDPAHKCEDILGRFLSRNDRKPEAKIKVAIDGEEFRSWYFRDISCIKRIYGNANDWLQYLSGPEGQRFFFINGSYEKAAPGIRAQLRQVLAEADGVTVNVMNQVLANLTKAENRYQFEADEVAPIFLGEYRVFLKSVHTCLSASDLAHLRHALSKSLTNPLQAVKKLTPVKCRQNRRDPA